MRRLLLAAAGAALLLLATPLHAGATSQARMDAAVAMSREVGHHGVHGPDVDRVLVLAAWRYAGVDVRGLDGPDGSGLVQACKPIDATKPRPAGPAPGDYALYRDTAGVQRVGMFLSQLDVAVVDGDTVRTVPSPELDGEIGQLAQERVLAEHGFLQACRLAASRWPGGRDDTSITAGRVALADPAYVADQLRWAAEHPRDADPSFWHPVQRILGSAAALVTGAVSSLVDAVVSAAGAVLGWLARYSPWPFAVTAFVLGLLGRTFDGRALHRILTGVLVAVVAGALLLFGGGVGWAVVGALAGGVVASARGVPVLGAIGGALAGAAMGVASFLVGTLTGVDDGAHVTVGGVAFALIADAFMARPLMAALGVATHAGRLGGLAHLLAPVERMPLIRAVAGHGRSVLDVASTAGDALALRPHALAETAHTIQQGIDAVRGVRVPAALAAPGAAPVHEAMSAAEAMMSSGRRGLDLLSLAWRPSSVSSDLLGHAADALQLLDAELRSGLPSLPRLRALLSSMDPGMSRRLVDAATHLSATAVEPLRITARMSHLHSGARTVMGVATHTQPSRPWMRYARPRVLRRAITGLPGATR